jgi:tetratricopeptide (TPR) repeat protein
MSWGDSSACSAIGTSTITVRTFTEIHADFDEAHLGLSAVFISENKPEQALLHLQKAVAINPQNEVAWYRLSVVQRALGNSAAQEKALAEFKRLHEKSSQQNLTTNFLSPQEETRQEIDANAPH